MIDIQTVIDKSNEMSPLWMRMDLDKRLYYLDKYVMKDTKGAVVSDIINVTLNLPATFAAHVQSSLMGAEEQVKVMGEMLAEDVPLKIERLIRAMLDAANALLLARGEPALGPFITEQLDIRGRAAARLTFRKNGSALVAEMGLIDTRHFVFEPDRNGGMAWGASTTWRSPSTVNLEYPDAKASGTQLVAITDVWDAVSNEVYMGGFSGTGTSIKPAQIGGVGPHTYGETPIVFREVPMGSMLKDADALAHRGESIFFLIRDLIPELNRLASILQTLNLESVHGPMEYASEEGPQATPPEYADASGIGRITSVGKGAIRRIDTGDIKAAGRLMQTILSRMIQTGSLSLTDFGSLSFPLSAVALVQLGEASGQVFLPRLGAKGLLMQGIAEMAVRQMIQLGGSLEIGTVGHRQTFNTSVLKGKYDTTFVYTVKAPETDAALIAIADSMRLFMDDDTIATKILKLPNPKEVRAKRRIDEAERISPGIKQYRTAQALLDEGREVEAEIMAAELGITIEQLEAGEVVPPKAVEEPRPNVGNDLALFPGTREFSNTRATQLAGEPREEVGEAT